MYVNRKMISVQIVPGIRGGRMKVSSGGGQFKYDKFDLLQDLLKLLQCTPTQNNNNKISTMGYLQRIYHRFSHIQMLKVKRWKKIFCDNINIKEARVDMFTSDKTNFQWESFFRDKVIT
jgi:hypothetical protein